MKWRYIEGYLRKNIKTGKKQCKVWFTITIPQIRYNDVEQSMGWKWKNPMISIELKPRKMFMYWKTIKD